MIVYHRAFFQTIISCLWLLRETQASIRVESTGHAYESRLDDTLGPRLADYQVYKARLQQLKGNSHLCYPPSESASWNITVPADGSAVALLVQHGFCSDETKARHASMFVQPADTVKFLIIDGGESHGIGDIRNQHTIHYGDTSSFGLVASALHRRRNLAIYGDEINLSVLHVSTMAGYEMMNVLLQESSSVRSSGGSILEITGESPSDSDDWGSVWVTLIAMLCVFGCIILLSLVSKLVESTQPVQRPPARPRLRQLNPWQVRNKFPVGIFDGAHVNFPTSRRKLYSSRRLENEDGQDNNAETSSAIDSTCTVCLDEFEAGDRVRILPCGHAFHSKCIMKWMTERSATCPLCKVDYYESDEEEDDDVETTSATPLSTSGNSQSITPDGLTIPSGQAGQLSQEEVVVSGSGSERRRTIGRAFRGWGRTVLRRLRIMDPVNNDGIHAGLSEPLLSPTTAEDVPIVESDIVATQAPTSEIVSSEIDNVIASHETTIEAPSIVRQAVVVAV